MTWVIQLKNIASIIIIVMKPIIVIVITLTIYFGYYVPVIPLSSYILNFIAFFFKPCEPTQYY